MRRGMRQVVADAGARIWECDHGVEWSEITAVNALARLGLPSPIFSQSLGSI